MMVYVGAYTGPNNRGISLFDFNAATGQLSSAGLAAETVNPSFVTIHPSRRFLYAVNETGDVRAGKNGSVSAFAIDAASGKLTLLNQQDSGGASPCYAAVDATGRCLLVANYSSGTVAAYPIADDGRLGPIAARIQHGGKGPNPRRQEGPHAHWIDVDPTNHFAIAVDLGIDRLMLYRLNPAAATLQPNTPPSVQLTPGSGPRHLAFHPNGRWAYVITELASTMTAMSCDAQTGTFKELQTLPTLPPTFTGRSTAAGIQVHPSGRFLYGSNRGDDSIVIFSIDQSTGLLTLVAHQPTAGKTPRHFAIDPTGHHLIVANQDSHSLTVFSIDPATGKLTQQQIVETRMPTCVTFLPQ
jgi:6-phosphogluconolactonase